MTCPENDSVEAKVTGLSQIKNEQIAFATTQDYGTVTFALSPNVWSGASSPGKGEVVILSGMTRYSKGWRAKKARQFVVTDELKHSASC